MSTFSTFLGRISPGRQRMNGGGWDVLRILVTSAHQIPTHHCLSLYTEHWRCCKLSIALLNIEHWAHCNQNLRDFKLCSTVTIAHQIPIEHCLTLYTTHFTNEDFTLHTRLHTGPQYTLYYTGFHDPTLKHSNWHTTATASSNGILLILVALPMCDTYSWHEVRSKCWGWCWAISSQTLWNTLECGGGGHQYLTRRLSLSSHFLLRLIGQLYHTSMFLY